MKRAMVMLAILTAMIIATESFAAVQMTSAQVAKIKEIANKFSSTEPVKKQAEPVQPAAVVQVPNVVSTVETPPPTVVTDIVSDKTDMTIKVRNTE